MGDTARELEAAVREAVRERFDEIDADDRDEWLERADDNGDLSEIADGSVPIYTYDLLQLAAEHLDFAVDEPELGPAFDGSPTPVNIIAANVYDQCCQWAWDEVEAIKGEVEDSEAVTV